MYKSTDPTMNGPFIPHSGSQWHAGLVESRKSGSVLEHPNLPALTMMRHGTTTWSEEDRFSGWGDAPVSPAGEELVRKAGKLLKEKGFKFDIAYTSRLRRAQETLDILIEEMGQPDLPIERDWRLNERHYGVLQERHRSAVAAEFGSRATIGWRRAYRECPPALSDDDPRWLEQLQRLPMIPEPVMPRSESMADCVGRVEQCWHESLAPALSAGKRVLVVAHTCSIRGLVRILDVPSEEETEAFRLPVALPITYELDAQLRPRTSDRLYGGTQGWWRHLKNHWKPRWLYWS